MNSFTRFPRALLLVATATISVTALALALAPSVFASSPRSEDRGDGRVLHVTKVCTPQTPPAFTFCTITSSNLGAIANGSRVVYLQAAGATALDSNVVLVVGPGNYALGHVYLPLPSGPGQVTFSGGTGSFTRFNARVIVTRDFTIPRGWVWNGTYSFGPRDDSAASESASSQQSGDRDGSRDLHVTKVCSPQTPPAFTFCTITSSNLATIAIGSRVLYLQAAGATALDSDVVLVVGPGNYALGHVHLPLPVGPGQVTFSGGTGNFTRFNASVVVTRDLSIPRGWIWNGTYRFSADD
jgi:hypothetical protein